LSIELPASIGSIKGKVIDTGILGRVRLVDANYENPDGSVLAADTDLLGKTRAEGGVIGPIASLQSGANRVRVW
jgi:hypothetical protein